MFYILACLEDFKNFYIFDWIQDISYLKKCLLTSSRCCKGTGSFNSLSLSLSLSLSILSTATRRCSWCCKRKADFSPQAERERERERERGVGSRLWLKHSRWRDKLPAAWPPIWSSLVFLSNFNSCTRNIPGHVNERPSQLIWVLVT